MAIAPSAIKLRGDAPSRPHNNFVRLLRMCHYMQVTKSAFTALPHTSWLDLKGRVGTREQERGKDSKDGDTGGRGQRGQSDGWTERRRKGERKIRPRGHL